MTQRISFRIAVAAAAVAMSFQGLTTARAQSTDFDSDVILRVFHERVESYAALHRQLAPPPSALSGTDSLSRLLSRQYLASALRSARPYAQQGDIFTPSVARVFRMRLADSIGELDGAAFLLELSGGQLILHDHPFVNEPYSMTPVYRIPADVRLGLPPLPAELDYRIVSRDLVLWDIYAGIVVDFVPNAFTTTVTTE